MREGQSGELLLNSLVLWAYNSLDRLNASLWPLLIIGVILGLAAFFAFRELLSWYIKVDALREDVRALEATALQLFGEVRQMREQLSRSTMVDFKEDARVIEKRPFAASAPPAPTHPASMPQPLNREPSKKWAYPIRGIEKGESGI